MKNIRLVATLTRGQVNLTVIDDDGNEIIEAGGATANTALENLVHRFRQEIEDEISAMGLK